MNPDWEELVDDSVSQRIKNNSDAIGLLLADVRSITTSLQMLRTDLGDLSTGVTQLGDQVFKSPVVTDYVEAIEVLSMRVEELEKELYGE